MTKTEESQKFWSFSEDIQFLRALAVLAVVFYYENFIDLASGYLGVDVFSTLPFLWFTLIRD